MGVPKRLTEMQKRFAEYIVFNEGRTTGADAAIAAGYSEKRARVEATNAEKNRGMAAGLYIDRKIIKTGKLEDLSEEELESKMKKILDDYAPILNAKQVDALPLEITEESKSKDKTSK